MDFEILSELDDIKTWITAYADRAAFVSDACENERSSLLQYEGAAEAALSITVTYNDIINDYLRLLQGKANKLSALVNRLYEQARAQKQSTAE